MLQKFLLFLVTLQVLALLFQSSDGEDFKKENGILVKKNFVPGEVNTNVVFHILARRKGRGRGGGGGGGPSKKKKKRDENEEGVSKEDFLRIQPVSVLSGTPEERENARKNDEAAKNHLDGYPRPYKQLDDPSDADINKPFSYQGAFVYENNPCEWYQQKLDSEPNKDRSKGWDNAVKRFKAKQREVPSARCKDPGDDGKCFQSAIDGRTGRCYVRVEVSDPAKKHFELINRC